MNELSEIEAGIGVQLLIWIIERQAQILDDEARLQGILADRAKLNRDQHNKEGGADGTDLTQIRLWYKFHGQEQGHTKAQKDLTRRAMSLRERAERAQEQLDAGDAHEVED